MQIAIHTSKRTAQPKLRTDPAKAFVRVASEELNGALVRCEERFPVSGGKSVLVAVVEKDAGQCREKLKTVRSDLVGSDKSDPLASIQLEVIDRATNDAIQRLIDAGLISKTTGATRLLFSPDGETEATPLSPEEMNKAKACRDRAARKLKMAKVLGESGMEEEAWPALLEAIHAMGSSFAIERRLPAPGAVKDTLEPPLSPCWADGLPLLQAFIDNAPANWKPAAEYLAKMSAG